MVQQSDSDVKQSKVDNAIKNEIESNPETTIAGVIGPLLIRSARRHFQAPATTLAPKEEDHYV